jgi:transcriptional regulator with XRE-family HTH domain
MTKGEKISKHRKILGLSQEDLANKLDISRQSVSKWELNESDPDLGNLVKLSKLLNITIDYLLNDSVDSVEPAQKNKVKWRFVCPGVFGFLLTLILWLTPIAWPKRIGALTFLGIIIFEGDFDGSLAYLFSDTIYLLLFLSATASLTYSVIYLFRKMK